MMSCVRFMMKIQMTIERLAYASSKLKSVRQSPQMNLQMIIKTKLDEYNKEYEEALKYAKEIVETYNEGKKMSTYKRMTMGIMN